MSVDDVEEGDHHVGVELGGNAPEEFRNRSDRVESPAIPPILGHRVVGVRDADDAAAERDVRAGETGRVTLTVEPFVRSLTIIAESRRGDVAERMSAPASTWALMMAISPRVSGDGLVRTLSGIASWPTS